MVYLKTDIELEKDINRNLWIFVGGSCFGLGGLIVGFIYSNPSVMLLGLGFFMMASIFDNQRTTDLIRKELRRIK